MHNVCQNGCDAFASWHQCANIPLIQQTDGTVKYRTCVIHFNNGFDLAVGCYKTFRDIVVNSLIFFYWISMWWKFATNEPEQIAYRSSVNVHKMTSHLNSGRKLVDSVINWPIITDIRFTYWKIEKREKKTQRK